MPLGSGELDALYELPYTRRPHPRYESAGERFRPGRSSRTRCRSCAAASAAAASAPLRCTRGGRIESRSQRLHRGRGPQPSPRAPAFKGHVSDLGGPTANMYRMGCTRPEVEARCQAALLRPPQGVQAAGHQPPPPGRPHAREPGASKGVRKVHVASGIRMDLAADEPEYLEELARHHVGGHLKVAPEHVSETDSWAYMKKPGPDGLRALRRGLPGGLEARRARSSTWFPTSWRAIPAVASRR